MIRRQKGFTLIEAIVAAVIIAILMAIAMPSLRTVLQNNNSNATAYQFEEFLLYARNESNRRNVPVTVCPASNLTLTSCVDSSAYASTTSWGNGWIAFLDVKNNRQITTPNNILKVTPPLFSGDTITSQQAFITYDGTNVPIAGTGTYTIKAANCRGGATDKVLTITSSAYLRITNTSCR